MELTRKQEEGLKIAVERYKNKEAYTCISGYAGSGKSTLIKFIIQALNLCPDEVCYVAYTGKAAEVLNHKNCPNARTAHKLLYDAFRAADGSFVFRAKTELDPRPKLIVVDEVSMLPNEMWELLLSHHIYTIAVGDPFQLPPVNKDTDNHVLDNPHVFLDEIMRQATDSEIIRLTMDIRNYKILKPFCGQEAKVLNKKDFVFGMYDWADQIICATNKTRFDINNIVRKSQGREGSPQLGDKIICLKNNWDIIDSNGISPLINGSIGYITNVEESVKSYPQMRRCPNFPQQIPIYKVSFETKLGEHFKDIVIDKTALDTGVKLLTGPQEYQLYRKMRADVAPIEFNYGYAITCHRAQGSEWDNILVMEETFPFTREEHARWLYTACTRAAEKLILIKST